MAVTTNKGYELIVTGTEVDTWGDKLNTDVFNRIDANLGGVTTKTLSNVNVDLNATESRTLRLVLNGTLTGDVAVTTLAVGMTIIENNCTGNFTVTFRKAGVGTPIVIPNGTNNLLTTGASGDPELIGVEFPPGTRIAFQQTTPPAGWSKDTSTPNLNNSTMRIVTGSVGSGGDQNFTTVFTNTRTPSGTVQDTTLNTNQIPAHRHFILADEFPAGNLTINNGNQGTKGGNFGNDNSYFITGSSADATVGRSSSVGGSSPHNHGLSMSAMNFNVRYFDFSIGVKL